MTEQQKQILQSKLPDLLYSFIREGRADEILSSMSVDSKTLLNFLEGGDFPTEKQLKGFCDHFKLQYSTLKTWNVTQLND